MNLALTEASGRHSVVIVGGGAGGLELAIRLGRNRNRSRLRVLLVDRYPTHLWKPRLHEVAVGLLGADAEGASYLALATANGFEFHLGELTDLDLATRRVWVGRVEVDGKAVLPERSIGYDSLVLAIGSRVNDFGIPGVVQHCHMLDSASQASELQQSFIEAAVQVAAGQRAALSIGIVGAGATGVELAAELHHAAHALQLYGGLGTEGKLSITLIDRAERVLPGADERTSAAAKASLDKLGVRLRLSRGVQEASERSLKLDNGEDVPCDIKVWASGVAGHKVLGKIFGLELGKGGRIVVDANLRCRAHQSVYAIGDCASAPDSGGGVLPPTAQVAHQQAAYLARAIEAHAAGKPVEPFRHVSRGMLVSLGANDAAGEYPSLGDNKKVSQMRGGFAKLAYVSLFHMHRVTLYGWSRAAALFIADRLRGLALPRVKLH